MITEWLLLAVGLLLTAATGVFVAAEFSLITLDRPDVERAAATSRSARSVLAGMRTLSTQLSGAQVGITITTLLVGYLVEPSLSRLLETPLTALGLPGASVPAVSVGAGMVIATVVSMILGELIPKNLAIAVPMRTASWSVPLQRAFTWVMGPLIAVLNGSANSILRSWGIEPQEELSSGRSPQELASLVRRSAAAGTLDAGTATLVTRSIGFSGYRAEDVMTHRLDVHVVPAGGTAEDVIRAAVESGHSRFPVVDDGLDDIVGIVHVKAAASVPRDRREHAHVRGLMVDALRVPSTRKLDPLLLELRAEGMQLAVVVDEYGGTAGVVTLEDLVEELVGEVVDEHDLEDPPVRAERDGSYLLAGDTRPDEVREWLGAGIPDSHVYETLAGFVMHRLGRLPRTGDVVLVDDWRLQVSRMTVRRIDEVRLSFEPGLVATPAPGEPRLAGRGTRRPHPGEQR